MIKPSRFQAEKQQQQYPKKTQHLYPHQSHFRKFPLLSIKDIEKNADISTVI